MVWRCWVGRRRREEKFVKKVLLNYRPKNSYEKNFLDLLKMVVTLGEQCACFFYETFQFLVWERTSIANPLTHSICISVAVDLWNKNIPTSCRRRPGDAMSFQHMHISLVCATCKFLEFMRNKLAEWLKRRWKGKPAKHLKLSLTKTHGKLARDLIN